MKDIQDGIKVSIQDGVTEDPNIPIPAYLTSGTARLVLASPYGRPQMITVLGHEVVTPTVATMTAILTTAVT